MIAVETFSAMKFTSGQKVNLSRRRGNESPHDDSNISSRKPLRGGNHTAKNNNIQSAGTTKQQTRGRLRFGECYFDPLRAATTRDEEEEKNQRVCLLDLEVMRSVFDFSAPRQ
ncbi:hypothetical protein E3U43_007461 [Larimichthys crocea]|uniref:Uncharacterized protein n=1 Tax=Larimichthys crocea TaxID=215358 RepID=A0ACD3Q5H8_LARCR|nr:hypothetical protein E3U43_007461 [Larimichthys crocea]